MNALSGTHTQVMMGTFGLHAGDGSFRFVSICSHAEATALQADFDHNNVAYKWISVADKANHPAWFLKDEMPTAGNQDWTRAGAALTNASDAPSSTLTAFGAYIPVAQPPFADVHTTLWFLWGVKGRQGENNPNLFGMVLDQLLRETAPVRPSP